MTITADSASWTREDMLAMGFTDQVIDATFKNRTKKPAPIMALPTIKRATAPEQFRHTRGYVLARARDMFIKNQGFRYPDPDTILNEHPGYLDRAISLWLYQHVTQYQSTITWALKHSTLPEDEYDNPTRVRQAVYVVLKACYPFIRYTAIPEPIIPSVPPDLTPHGSA